MVRALRPGGWLVVEDFDWRAMCTHPPDEHVQVVMDVMAAVMSQSGYDPAYGRKLDLELERVGLSDVSAEGRVRICRGGYRATAMLRLSIDSLRSALVDSGKVGFEDVDRALARLDDPDTTFEPGTDRGTGSKGREGSVSDERQSSTRVRVGPILGGVPARSVSRP